MENEKGTTDSHKFNCCLGSHNKVYGVMGRHYCFYGVIGSHYCYFYSVMASFYFVMGKSWTSHGQVMGSHSFFFVMDRHHTFYFIMPNDPQKVPKQSVY